MRKICLLLTLILCLTSCKDHKTRYQIGVSQCSADIWREKQNAELKMGAYCHDNVELRFATAYDSDKRQIQQIDSLVATGIDLLIVAPNQIKTISPAIDRAYDKGIPVIVFERKTSSQKYTAFISADNYEMGHVMGQYIAGELQGKGRVMEIMGLKGSSPAIERHKGFTDALKAYPGIDIVATLQGDWTEKSAYQATKEWQTQHPTLNTQHPIDYVFGQNDRMAVGARKVLSALNPNLSTKFCGIDGLPGENGGIRLVRDSILDASYIYPTHGDKIIDIALDILDGKPYDKETLLMSALVTRKNAKVLLVQNEEILRQSEYLDQLHSRADTYLQKLDTQRIVNWMAIGVIILLMITIVLLYLYHLKKIALQRERVVSTLWNMDTTNIQPEASSKPLPDDTKTDSDEADEVKPAAVSVFITRFKEVVETRLADSDISVEDLAADMNLSRVQLYRKVKAVTGSSPVELLRTARLNRGYQLLLTTDLSISEVAYQVGFTAPSYFTKCFKEEYGMLPGDVRQ
ncbi:MAG: substrate-binding domain-containing protein [Prevotella sp.]|nr:substrate-binding domain-containing protein [Prevotella sp.]